MATPCAGRPAHSARGRSRVQVVVEGLADRWGTRRPGAVAALAAEGHQLCGTADEVDDRRADRTCCHGCRQDARPARGTRAPCSRRLLERCPGNALPGRPPLRRARLWATLQHDAASARRIPVLRRRHLGVCRAQQHSDCCAEHALYQATNGETRVHGFSIAGRERGSRPPGRMRCSAPSPRVPTIHGRPPPAGRSRPGLSPARAPPVFAS